MTGYGKAECLVANNKKLVVEIKSLNSKSLDLSVRIAPQLRSKELEIRTLMAQRLERGKIDLSIYYQDAAQGDETSTFAPINREAFAYYYRELTALQSELGWANNQDIVAAILRMPDVSSRCFTIVDLPEPLGAQRIIIILIYYLTIYYLKDIQYLLFDLFEDIFHLHYDNLHLALVALAAEGVDLSSHLLRNETEFFANALLPYSLIAFSPHRLIPHGFAEVLQMVG